MKVGGPCRGLTRAMRLTPYYVATFILFGIPAAIVVGSCLEIPRHGFLRAGLFMLHFNATLFLVFPSALVANLTFCRLFRKRTWRNEAWRPWLAGFLGVVLTWSGMLLLDQFQPRPPAFLKDLLGPPARFVHVVGSYVLLSNLALFLVWLLPSRSEG